MDTTFIDRLVAKDQLSPNEAAIIKKESESSGVAAEELLLKAGINEDSILQVKGEVSGVEAKRVSGKQVPAEVIKYVPEDSARYYKFIPIGLEDGVLQIGMVDPTDIEAREALQFITSKTNIPFKIFLVSLSDFNSVLEAYKSLSGEVTRVVGELESALKETKGASQEKATPLSEVSLSEEAPVTKMVAVIIRHAIEGRASDIHIEPTKDKLRVRFRVDGTLYTSLLLPMRFHDAIISRVKILSKLKLDEKRKPQDGRFSTTLEKRLIDFRVSTLPTPLGEKTAIRILDPEKGIKALGETGLVGRDLDIVKKILARPYGLVLVTGPTGSGKTTTLYSMLQNLEREKNNIVSLEDPIEYNVEGVNQSQIRPELGYDFANGLRSILRQDPDIMLIGEIRDKKTAGLAIHAALTGHLVLATLHTNNAAGAIPRLIDMGVDEYLIAPTLIMTMAQRLVPTLCSDSKKKVVVSGNLRQKIEKEIESVPEKLKSKFKIPSEIYEAQPSARCPKGTRGRTGVFEVITMTPELENIVLTNPNQSAIIKEARKQGMTTMREDGLLKVFSGEVGYEGISRLI